MEYKINYQGADVVYYSNRNVGKETILFLHPAFSSAFVFQDQYNYFSGKYNWIGIDMPGHGKTKESKKGITFKEIEKIIDSILKKEKIDKVHIVGVSLGSLVAQSFADQYPEQVQSVVVVGGYSIHKGFQEIAKIQKKEQLKWIPSLLFSFNGKFKKKTVASSVYTEEGLRKFEESMNGFSFSSFMSMDGANDFFVEKNTEVNYPLLVLYGEHESEVALYAAKQFEKLEPSAIIKFISDAGHCINLDQAEKFNQEIEQFIKNKQ